MIGIAIVFCVSCLLGMLACVFRWRWYWAAGFVSLTIGLLLSLALIGYGGLWASARKEFYLFLLPNFFGSIPITLGGAFLGKTVFDLIKNWRSKPKS
jgi:hypothetical protein